MRAKAHAAQAGWHNSMGSGVPDCTDSSGRCVGWIQVWRCVWGETSRHGAGGLWPLASGTVRDSSVTIAPAVSPTI